MRRYDGEAHLQRVGQLGQQWRVRFRLLLRRRMRGVRAGRESMPHGQADPTNMRRERHVGKQCELQSRRVYRNDVHRVQTGRQAVRSKHAADLRRQRRLERHRRLHRLDADVRRDQRDLHLRAQIQD
jgi:hypothetical protein